MTLIKAIIIAVLLLPAVADAGAIISGGPSKVGMTAENDSGVQIDVKVDSEGHLITANHTESVALPDGLSNTANIDTNHAGIPHPRVVFPYVFNGTTWDRQKSYGGNLSVINQEYMQGIAEGDIPGHVLWTKYGYASAITAEATIWPLNSSYVFPSANTAMSIASSDNTQDKAGGTGALTVTVYYLNDSYVEHTTTVTLNGTTWVDLTPTDTFRINYMVVASVGTGGKPVGNITLADKATHTVNYGYISAGRNHSRMAYYTVPAGKALYINSICGSVVNTAANKSCRVILLATYDEQSDTVLTAGTHFMPFYEGISDGGPLPSCRSAPLVFPATVDIKFNAVSTGTSTVAVTMSGWIE